MTYQTIQYDEFTMMAIIERWLMQENRHKSVLQIAEENNVKPEWVHDAYKAYREMKR